MPRNDKAVTTTSGVDSGDATTSTGGNSIAASPDGAPAAGVVSAAAALAASAPTASAGTVSFSTRGRDRAPALRGARGARNRKFVMIESPSDALHAAPTGRTDIGGK